jgi:hypothetical protein
MMAGFGISSGISNFLSVPVFAPMVVMAPLAWRATVRTLSFVNAKTFTHGEGFHEGLLHSDHLLKISFKNPNKPWVGIPGKAMTALSVAVIGVKDVLLKPFKPSLEKTQALKIAFANNFRDAVQGTIDAATELAQKAEEKGLNFSVDADSLSRFSTRKIEIIENRGQGIAYNKEKTPLLAMNSLTDLMQQASAMETLDQDHLSALQVQFSVIRDSIEDTVKEEESKQKIGAIGALQVDKLMLNRY